VIHLITKPGIDGKSKGRGNSILWVQEGKWRQEWCCRAHAVLSKDGDNQGEQRETLRVSTNRAGKHDLFIARDQGEGYTQGENKEEHSRRVV